MFEIQHKVIQPFSYRFCTPRKNHVVLWITKGVDASGLKLLVQYIEWTIWKCQIWRKRSFSWHSRFPAKCTNRKVLVLLRISPFIWVIEGLFDPIYENFLFCIVLKPLHDASRLTSQYVWQFAIGFHVKSLHIFNDLSMEKTKQSSSTQGSKFTCRLWYFFLHQIAFCWIFWQYRCNSNYFRNRWRTITSNIEVFVSLGTSLIATASL